MAKRRSMVSSRGSQERSEIVEVSVESLARYVPIFKVFEVILNVMYRSKAGEDFANCPTAPEAETISW